MINGVMHIVAAVLFAMVYLFEGLGIMWLWIAAFYLVVGIVNLISHVVREKVKVRAANKKAEKTAQEAESSRREAEEAKKKLIENVQEAEK